MFGTQVQALHSGKLPDPGGEHHVALASQNVVAVAVSLYVNAGKDPVHVLPKLE